MRQPYAGRQIWKLPAARMGMNTAESLTETLEIDRVLRDPAASRWLKAALDVAFARDPDDTANDAGVLAGLLYRQCRAILERHRPKNILFRVEGGEEGSIVANKHRLFLLTSLQ